MNNNKPDIDNYTKKLVSKAEIMQPGPDFTRNVMSHILKNPSIKISFVSKYDRQSNLWLFLTMAFMFIGYAFFYTIRNGFSFSKELDNVHVPASFNVLIHFISNLWNELSLSPYVLISIIGVVILVILDKTIVKYLYSI